MAYSLCAACGAKTLIGATRCPRCQTPLVSYAADAKRPETVRCPSCGVLRPVAIGICPNCHSGPEQPTQRSIRGLILASGAVLVILVIGFAISKFVEPPAQAAAPASAPAPAVTSPMLSDREPTDNLPFDSTHAASTRAAGSTAQRSPSGVTPPPPSARQNAPVPAPAPDSGWSYWRAVTWVRLRDKPGKDGHEVRIIDSAQHVMLGPATNGWRGTRVGNDRGWVDPRFFVPVTKP